MHPVEHPVGASRRSPFPVGSTGPIWTRWPRWRASGGRGGGAAHGATIDGRRGGISPGFAYLEGLPAALRAVPRRSRPAVVPAGSVAIANGQAAVYPTASPGGWHLVGRTGFGLFSAERSPYAVLAPGDRVQFTVARSDDPAEPAPVAAPQWTLPAGARAVFEIVAPGLRAVVQDGGRRAVAAVGVPAPVPPTRCRSNWPTG